MPRRPAAGPPARWRPAGFRIPLALLAAGLCATLLVVTITEWVLAEVGAALAMERARGIGESLAAREEGAGPPAGSPATGRPLGSDPIRPAEVLLLGGTPLRILSATDPRRVGTLLSGLEPAGLLDLVRRALASGKAASAPPAVDAPAIFVTPVSVPGRPDPAGGPPVRAVAVLVGNTVASAWLSRSLHFVTAGVVALIAATTIGLAYGLRRTLTGPLGLLARDLHGRADGGGEIARLAARSDEIGEVAKAVEAASRSLAESETRFDRIAEAIDDIIWLIDYAGERKFRFVSPSFVRLFGAPRDTGPGGAHWWLEAVHPEDRERVGHWALQSADIATAEIEYRILREDGSLCWLRSKAFPIRNQSGEIVELAGVTSDVTALKLQAEELSRRTVHTEAVLRELRAAEDRSRAILGAIPDVLFEVTPELDLVAYNARRPEDVYFPIDDFLGRNLAEFVPAKAVALCRAGVEEALRTGAPTTVEFEAVHKGAPRFFEARITPIGSGNVLAILRDVTRKQQREQTLRDARDAAEAATRAKGEFLATMSHEIRTPLNAVIGMSSLLLDGPLSGEQKEHAATIRASGEALLSIVSDVLDYSRLDAGKLVLESQPVPVQELVSGVMSIFAGEAPRRGNVMVAEIAGDVPERILSDAGRIRQVLLNLVGNASKFTEQGRIALRVGVERAEGEQSRIRFEVSDTGPGIREEQQEQIFDPFTQADGSMSRRFGGTGLGLAICKRLVERMDGRIGVRSQLGKGSLFWFSIPLQQPKSEAVAAAGPRARVRTLPGLRVLLAEDNPVNAKLAAALLGRLGCVTEVVGNGRKALEALARERFDVVLMDCQMPELDGLEATREIRRREGDGPRLPVVALTANAMPGDRERCLEAGMDGYLAKPFRIDDLLAALEPFVPDPAARIGRA